MYIINKWNTGYANSSLLQPNTVELWLIIGPRGSGKTILLRDILYKTRKHYDIGLAMTGTATTSSVETLRDFIPYHLIYKQGYNYEICDTLLKTCKNLTAEGKQQNALLVLDDCMFDNKVMKPDAQTAIHLRGRTVDLVTPPPSPLTPPTGAHLVGLLTMTSLLP